MTLDDVILALEMTSDASEAFYDLVTHEITWLDDFGMTREEYEKASDTLDEHGFKRLPSRRDIDEYGMPVSLLLPPEAVWGYAAVTAAYSESPEDSARRIAAQIRKHWTSADEKAIWRMVGRR